MKMKMKRMLRGSAAVAAVLAVCGALMCRADWAQAESAEFMLDTTIPEPAAMAAAVLPLWVLLRRR